MKIYTKTGDLGDTGLFAGPRVRKDDLRIEAYGTVDELNAVIGLARAACAPAVVSRSNETSRQPLTPALSQREREKEEKTSQREREVVSEIDSLLASIQHSLFDLGAELATPDPKSRGTSFVTPAQIEILEQAIDQYEAQLPALKTFILPGGTPGAAWLHLARTVCRRAERRLVTLLDRDVNVANRAEAKPSPHLLVYLNRLSDLLFVLARAANHAAGHGDIEWQKPAAGKS